MTRRVFERCGECNGTGKTKHNILNSIVTIKCKRCKGSGYTKIKNEK